jgi:deoxycytidylate deaminase
MRIDITRFHEKAKVIFNREQLYVLKQKVIAFVLDDKGRILTEGWNSYTKTHPIQKKAAQVFDENEKCYMHAEIHALSRLRRSQTDKKHSMVIIRLGTDENMLPGKPCRICNRLIQNYGINTIIHS